MPSPRANHQRRRRIAERVGLSVGALESQSPPHRSHAIELAADDIGPGWRQGIFKIGHEDLGAGVQRVDHHLGVGGAGDLDPAVPQVQGRRRNDPGQLPGRRRLTTGNRAAFQPRSPRQRCVGAGGVLSACHQTPAPAGRQSRAPGRSVPVPDRGLQGRATGPASLSSWSRSLHRNASHTFDPWPGRARLHTRSPERRKIANHGGWPQSTDRPAGHAGE